MGYQSTFLSITENKSIKLKQFVELVEFDEILLSRSFQKEEKEWTLEQKSRFIESLIMLELPFQHVILQQLDNGTLIVFDGMNRLKTIYDFVKNKFRLTGLIQSKEIENSNYTDLFENTLISELKLRMFNQKEIRYHQIDFEKNKIENKEIYFKMIHGIE